MLSHQPSTVTAWWVNRRIISVPQVRGDYCSFAEERPADAFCRDGMCSRRKALGVTALRVMQWGKAEISSRLGRESQLDDSCL